MSNSKENVCCYTLCSAITWFTAIFYLFCVIEYAKLGEIEKGNCTITQVTYPESLEDREHFIRCNCKGKSCYSDSGICINIYGQFENEGNTQLIHDSVQHGEDVCTFAEKRCPKGSKIEDRLSAVANAKISASKYISPQNITIGCYKYQDQFYLDNDITTVLIIFIVFSVLFGLFIICWCSWTFNCICECCDRDKINNPPVIV